MKFDYLKTFAESNNIKLNDKQITQFEKFAEMLVEQNKVMNLTGITDPYQIEIKHMIDSLYGYHCIKEFAGEDFSLLDIGCGAGFPGIPLKIAFPENEFVLLDSLNKRIRFVKEVISELALENASAVSVRAEDYDKKEYFDVCVSRAVAEMNVLLEYSMPFIKIGGYCILYKSGDIQNEILDSSKAIDELGGKYLCTKDFKLPDNFGSRSLVIIQKIKNTPDKYPRRAGKPSKSPIR